MNCCTGDKSEEFLDWSVNLPESSSEEWLTNKNYNPLLRNGCKCIGRAAWGIMGAHRQETFLERMAQQLNTQERPPIYPKVVCSWEKGCPMWRPHITEVRRSSRTDLVWLSGGLSSRQWKRHQSVQWNSHSHKQNTLQVLGAQNRNLCGSHTKKIFANSLTLSGLSNYRASTTADTCNLTYLVRVAQQRAL